MAQHYFGFFCRVHSGERHLGGNQRHRHHERHADERDAAAGGDRRAPRRGRHEARHPAAIHPGKRDAMPGRGFGRDLVGIPGGAGPAHVYTVSSVGAVVGGDPWTDAELRGRLVFWHLPGGARVAAGPGGGLAGGLTAAMTLVQIRENFLTAMETLRSSKVRSALTVLGIVIGVSSVISMAAIIQGLNQFVQDKVESLGSRTYFLSRFPPGTDPTRWPESIRTRKYFEYNYADYISQAAPDVPTVTTVGTRGFFFGDSNLISSGNRSVERVIVRGAEPQYTEAIPLFTVERGRFISAFDQEHARPVVVLGAAISESLFPNTDAVGKTVRINGGTYEVIGVFEHDEGLFLGPGVDIFAIIPLSNFKKNYPEAKELILIFTVPQDINVETAQDEVIQAMRRLRRVPADKENDFELSSPDFLSSLWNQLTGALVILTTVISSVG